MAKSDARKEGSSLRGIVSFGRIHTIDSFMVRDQEPHEL